ncbi:hypothetical protein D3C71_2068520 [compost metagenome]
MSADVRRGRSLPPLAFLSFDGFRSGSLPDSTVSASRISMAWSESGNVERTAFADCLYGRHVVGLRVGFSDRTQSANSTVSRASRLSWSMPRSLR